MAEYIRTVPMSDELKISLARAIHGTPHATRDSFSPSTWAGVERAWAWVEKHYQPKEPTVKQETELGDNDTWQAPNPETMEHSGDAIPYLTAYAEPVPPWTEAQREAARPLWMAHAMGTLTFNGTLEAIAKVAPMFVDQNTAERMSRDAATREERFSEHGRQPTQADQGIPRPLDGGDCADERSEGEGRGVGGVGGKAPRDAEPRRSMGVDRGDGLADGHHGARPLDRAADDVLSGNRGGEAQPAPSPAPAGVSSPVSCPCSKCGHGRHEHDRYGSCLASGSGHGGFCTCGRYEDKDGASVPGDSGLKSGHNMERGSGCPASDDHADRETSTPHAPKEQAPSPVAGVAPWPDRVELARIVRKTRFDYVNERDWHGEPASVDFMHADAALAVFQPALRTRNERIAEQAATIATLTKERDDLNASVRRLAVDFDGMVTDRDAALARVAELEKRGAVDVEACARELAEMSTPYQAGRPLFVSMFEPILRKHSRDVRRITREEQIRAVAALVESRILRTSATEQVSAIFNAIGFEVEA